MGVSITSDIFAPDVNFVPARNVYPDAAGGTLGSVTAGSSPDTTRYVGGGSGVAIQTPAVSSGRKPVIWWIALLAIFVALVWLTKRTGERDGVSFGNLRASGYNVFFITLTAVLGLTILKVVFSKVRVPGLSDVILAT